MQNNTDNSVLAEKGIFMQGIGGSFANEVQNDKMFKLEVTNTGDSAEDRIICLCPGNYTTTSELSALGIGTIAAIVSDGEVISTSGKEVSCEGSPGTIESLKRKFLRHPVRLTGMSIEVSNAAQLNQPIKVYKDDPFQSGMIPVVQINPASYKSNSNFNDKLVHIPLDHFQLDNEHVIIFTLKAGYSITLNLSPGAEQNSNTLLENEARKAFESLGLKRTYRV